MLTRIAVSPRHVRQGGRHAQRRAQASGTRAARNSCVSLFISGKALGIRRLLFFAARSDDCEMGRDRRFLQLACMYSVHLSGTESGQISSRFFLLFLFSSSSPILRADVHEIQVNKQGQSAERKREKKSSNQRQQLPFVLDSHTIGGNMRIGDNAGQRIRGPNQRP